MLVHTNGLSFVGSFGFALGLEVVVVGAGFPGAFLGLGLAVWNFFSNSVKFLLAILVGHGFVGWGWVVGWVSWFCSGLVICFGFGSTWGWRRVSWGFLGTGVGSLELFQ